MNARLLDVLSLSAELSNELIKFVTTALESMTPSSKGWQDRAIPSLVQEWTKKKQMEGRAEFAALQEEWLNSDQYAAKAAEARRVELCSSLPLEVGESLVYRGCQLATHLTPHGYISRERSYSHHVTDGGHWIGEDYASEGGNGPRADRFFIPSGMKIKVDLLDSGCPLSFQVCRVTRTA